MARRNLTVELDVEVVHKAKVIAAQRSTSVSRLVAEQIERLVGEDENYQRAARDALAMLEHGYPLGGGPLPKRADLYDR